jgi:DoxX-like family
MKKNKIAYWVVTALFLLLMLFSSLSSLFSRQQAVAFFSSISLPAYLIPFLSVAKILGVMAILIPGIPRIKEWAYAGLMFDLIGAAWCTYSVSKSFADWAPMLLFIALGFASYFLYHKRLVPQSRS